MDFMYHLSDTNGRLDNMFKNSFVDKIFSFTYINVETFIALLISNVSTVKEKV